MMIKNFMLYNPHSNTDVTSYYVNLIGECLKEMAYDVKEINKLDRNVNNRETGIVVVDLKDSIEAKKCGYGYIIYWIQGVAPEEAFLKKNDLLRYFLYSYRECKALNAANFVFYCSNTMKQHYEKKYHYKLDGYYVMPCFNEEIKPIKIKNKEYSDNIFVYAGSLEKWQNFENTVKFYKDVEKRIDNAVFKVFVKDRDRAEKILKEHSVKHFCIDYVTSEKLSDEIDKAKFGFCLRKNITVNKVATPTKLSNYVANGVMPIYSKCLNGFYEKAKNSSFCFNGDDPDVLERIINACERHIKGVDVLKDYKECFGEYYSSEYHKKEICRVLKNILKGKE